MKPTVSILSPVQCIALTFLFLGGAYAFPLAFYSLENYALGKQVPLFLLNLNLITAWMGLSHFYFAYRGQYQKGKHGGKNFILSYLLALCFSLILLVFLYQQMANQIFHLVVWAFFIPHFIKAESLFIGFQKNTNRLIYPYPTIAFIYFTLALYLPDYVSVNQEVLFGVGVLLGAGGVLWYQRGNGSAQGGPFYLLGTFFIAEGLLWGTFAPYMPANFQYGVYSFHISAASFYHYFRSYQFALTKTSMKATGINQIVLINLLVLGAGTTVLTLWPESFWRVFFGYEFFTIYVALHLAMSEWMPILWKLTTQNKS